MSNPLTFLQAISPSNTLRKPTSISKPIGFGWGRGRMSDFPPSRMILSVAIGLTLWCALGVSSLRASAASADTAPAELKTMVQQIDAAANREDIEAMMQFYSPNYTNSDGFTRQSFKQALSQLWQRYSNLNYRTEIVSWERDENGYSVETVTEITGVEELADRQMQLTATLRSRQRYQGEQIVQQEILAERTQLASGDNPPTLQINLPEEIKTGERYNFDAIVLEPLRNDLLLGYAVEEPVQSSLFLTPSSVELEPLSAGGIFKIGQAPSTEDSRWVSAVVVRKDGMTMVTQRLRVVGSN